MNVNQAIEQIGELLGFPMAQSPNVRQRFGALMRERQNYYNELANSSVAWTVRTVHISPSTGQTEYLVSGSQVGRVLFVTADISGVPFAVAFTDPADRTQDGFDFGSPSGYSSSSGYSDAPSIAFLRREGQLYAKLPAAANVYGTLTITYALGNWTENQSLSASPVLTEYEHLPNIRAARNLLSSCRWTEDLGIDQAKAQMISQELRDQEARVYEQFLFAKRALHADDVTFIDVF